MILEYEKIGPKVPGSPAHEKGAAWIQAEIKKHTDMVHFQVGEIENPLTPGKKVAVKNIFAQLNPKAEKRFLLSAHWDNRPYADNDSSRKNRTLAVPGVNDGGSGVAVLLSIAKALKENVFNETNYQRFRQGFRQDFGVDFAFWDVEDLGQPGNPDSYCLGSLYWSKNKTPQNYKAELGYNFDMVGRMGSVFPIERGSEKNAPEALRRLREAAEKLGYQQYFPSYRVGPIVDDHAVVTKHAGIPMANIIYMNPDQSFAPEWHTLSDTSEFISRDVLEMVSNTVLYALVAFK